MRKRIERQTMNQPARKDSVEQLDQDMAGKNLSGYRRLGMEGLPDYPVTSVGALSVEVAGYLRQLGARR